MLYLLEECLEIAENYDEENLDCANMLAGACEMGVIGIMDEDGELAGNGINVFLSSDNTGGEEPAFIQILIDEKGKLILDTGMPKKYARDMLEDQLDQARERLDFCKKALELLKPKARKKSAKKSAKEKYANAT